MNSVKPENQKSIFFVSLPKSGTVYTWCSLRETTGLKMPEFHLLEGWDAYNSGRDFSCPDLYACGEYNTQMLRPEQMRPFLKGFIFGAHMQASYHNMKVLEECGIDRVSVLIRDPRDAFVSWVHHLRHLGPSAREYHSRIYHIPRAYYDWSLEKQFDFQVRSFLPTVANWVEGWLDYYASPDRKIEILFVLYDELKRYPEAYIRKITEFHEVDEVDFSKLIVAKPGSMHFRQGEHEQWKVDFSAVNQRLSDELLQDRIQQGFERAARSHYGISSAESALAKGDFSSASKAVHAAIIQFPSCRYCYELLAEIAHKAGRDVSSFKDLIGRELRSLSIEDYFRNPDNLLKESAAISQSLLQPRAKAQTFDPEETPING